MAATTRCCLASLALGLFAGPVPVSASPVAVSTYSMPNGDGTASGGAFNYWDRTYSGTGSPNVDGAALSGARGKLTDGVIATQVWNQVSNSAGTGQYVGWLHSVTPNPVITFSFAGSPVIGEVDIYLDNSGVGGVFAPSAILIDGIGESFTAPTLGTVGRVAFTGLDLTGFAHTIQFDQSGANSWTFVSEITFDGTPGGVPEPGSSALALIGLATFVLVRRRSARPAGSDR
jgi:hypothetical protein